MKILAVFLALALSPLAFAQTAILTWTAPTLNTDQTTDTMLCGFNVYEAPTLAALSALPLSVNGGTPAASGISRTTLTYTFNNLAPGTYYFAVTALNCNAPGTTESAQAQSAAFTVPLPPEVPAAPTSVEVAK
jgi:hypothetical protein